jgi:hypothetical protein
MQDIFQKFFKTVLFKVFIRNQNRNRGRNCNLSKGTGTVKIVTVPQHCLDLIFGFKYDLNRRLFAGTGF